MVPRSAFRGILPAFVIFCLALQHRARAESHGGVEPDEPETVSAPDGGSPGGSLSLPSSSSSKSAGGDKPGGEARTKQGGGTPAPLSGVPSYSVFILADGPQAGIPASETRPTTAGIREILMRKVPGVHILPVHPFRLEAIENVKPKWNGVVSAVTVIVDADAGRDARGRLTFMTADGPVLSGRLGESVTRLAKRLAIRSMETVLLTGFAGAIECTDFSGHVFGMTSTHAARDPRVLDLWLKYQARKFEAPFPLSAREWFDSFAITNKLSRRNYFYCPFTNAKGYLGYREDDDPANDPSGISY